MYSPTSHRSFSTPLEMMAFITQLRELCGGKPVGFKLCIGERREFMGIVKAMLETDQAQRCHTNTCPVGVTTRNPRLHRALVVPNKAERVHRFHEHTVHALAEFVAAIGLDHPSELGPHHVVRRINATQVASLDEIYPFPRRGRCSRARPRSGYSATGTSRPRARFDSTGIRPGPHRLVGR